jgi:tetratricopeptide (TPR) repeat protein
LNLFGLVFGKRPKWRVGARVLAEWGTLRVLYSGTVAECGDASYHVRFDDGEFAWIPELKIRKLAIPVGSRLLGRAEGSSQWTAGTVEATRGEKVYLRYDDGREEWVPVSLIAVPPPKSDPVKAVLRAMDADDYGLAADILTDQLAETPDDPGLLVLRAEARHQLEYFEEAIQDCEHALALRLDDETLGKALYQRARSLLALNRCAEAEEDLQQAVALNRKNADYCLALGQARERQRRRESALDAYTQALAIQPEHLDALLRRAICLSALDRPSQAVEDLSVYLEHRPDQIPALAVRGCCYQKLNRPEEGIADLERVEELCTNPVSPIIHGIRAKMYEQTGRLEKALADLDAALPRAKTLDALHLHAERSRLLRALGRHDEAAEALQELDRQSRLHLHEVQRAGVPVTAALVMANTVLFDPESRENSCCRVLITFDPSLREQPERLLAMAWWLVSLKDTTQSDPQMQFLAELTTVEASHVNVRFRLPEDFTDGAVVYVTDLWVDRRIWPVLRNLLPCMAEPGDEGRQVLLPPGLAGTAQGPI